MRILHIVNDLDPKSGGPTRSITGICRALAQCELETMLLVHSPEHEMQKPSGVQVFKGRGKGVRVAYEDTERALQSFKPDIVHLHGLWLPVNHLDLSLTKRYRIPVMLSVRGMMAPWALQRKYFKKYFAWIFYQHSDLMAVRAFHATSAMEKRDIEEKGFKQPIFTIPNAVEIPSSNKPIGQLCNKGIYTALFLSRLHPGKGLLELAEAWAIMKKDGAVMPKTSDGRRPTEGWQMRIVGPDNYNHKAKVVARLKKLGIEKEWFFVGEVNDDQKWAEYEKAHLFILPSRSENFGISIAEALYAGLPVITTKGTPWQELLGNSNSSKVGKKEDGEQKSDDSSQITNAPKKSRANELAATGRCGWWTDIGVDQLVVALKDAMCLSDEERRQMGMNGRKLIESKYIWAAAAKNMAEAYRFIKAKDQVNRVKRDGVVEGSTRGIKILHIIDSLQKSAGTSVFCVELCDCLKSNGQDPTIAVVDPDASDLYPSSNNIPIISLNSILRSKNNPSFEIVHIHGIWQPVLHKAQRWAHKRGLPILWSPHGMVAPWALNHKRFKKYLAWHLYQKHDLRNASSIHVASDLELKWIRDLGFQQPCCVAPAGTHLSRMPIQEEREKHSQKTKILLFVGRVYPVKNLDTLIKAFANVKANRIRQFSETGAPLERWKLIIVGPDQSGHKGELLKLAKSLHLDAQDLSEEDFVPSNLAHLCPNSDIVFTGQLFDEAKNDVYKQADIFIFPSHSENFGCVLVEALSFGLPVIASDRTPWAEIEVNNCGRICGTGLDSITQVLEEMMAMPDEHRQLMGLRGRRWVENNFTWSEVSKKILTLYQDILKKIPE